MRIFLSYKKNIFTTCVLFSISSTALSSAWALDQEMFEQRLASSLRSTRFNFISDDIEIKDKNVIYHNASLQIKKTEQLNAPIINEIKIGDIYFNDIIEKSDRYIVSNITIPDFKQKNNNLEAQLQKLSIKNFVMPDLSDELSKHSILYESLNLKEFSLSTNSIKQLSVNDVDIKTNLPKDNAPLEFTYKIDNFSINPMITQSFEVIKIMRELNLKSLSGSFYLTGSLDLNNTGNFTVNEYTLNLDNLGKLKGNFSFSGITLNTMKLIDELDKEESKLNASSTKIDELETQLLKVITIKDFKLRYEDTGLVNKAINHVSKEQEIDADTLKDIIKEIPSTFTSELNSPDFAKEIDIATKDFINAPQSLELIIKPSNELSLQSIIDKLEDSESSIDDVIKYLNMHITANQ